MSKGIMTNGITTSEENYYYSKGYQNGREDAIEEVLQIIHNIYTQDSHCMSDMCDRDNQGYFCEDCLYNSVKQNLERLKESKNE